MRAIGPTWLTTVWLASLPAMAAAQTSVPFGTEKYDPTAQVEITSDRLDLDQGAGSAVFTGSVKVGQGELRLAADRVDVFYEPGTEDQNGRVRRLIATGNVTLANGTQAAEADRAVYEVAKGTVDLEGDVLLTQGRNALSSEKMTIDLNAGTGELQGRVRTIFAPQSTGAQSTGTQSTGTQSPRPQPTGTARP